MRALTRSGVILVLLVLGFGILPLGTANACRILGYVAPPGVLNLIPDAYNVASDSFYVQCDSLHVPNPPSNCVNASWSVSWFPPADAGVINRHVGNIQRVWATWDAERDQAAQAGSRFVLMHDRQVAADSPTVNEPNPHPFVYNDVFGRTWWWAHNGTIRSYNGGLGALEDSLGAGFACTDIFRDRWYARWGHSGRTIDSEYLFMATMKYFLITSNYYYSLANSSQRKYDPMPWAGAIATTRLSTGMNYYSSQNFICSNGDTTWVCRKETDGNHRIKYTSILGNEQHRIHLGTPESTIPGSVTVTNGYYGKFAANAAPLVEQVAPAGGILQSDEIRVKGLGSYSYKMARPVVAADPSTGNFVSVWCEGERKIQYRWYNQMGLSETNEASVVIMPATELASQPDVAVSPTGDRFIVTWKWRRTGLTYYDRIQARVFTRNGNTWTPGTIFDVNVSSSTNTVVDHPSCAMSADGGYVIVWKRTPGPGAVTDNKKQIHLYATPANWHDVIIASTTYEAHVLDAPDVADLGQNQFGIVWDDDWWWGDGAYGKLKLGLFDPATANYPNVYTVTMRNNFAMTAMYPSIARLTADRFVVTGYFPERIRVRGLQRNGLTLVPASVQEDSVSTGAASIHTAVAGADSVIVGGSPRYRFCFVYSPPDAPNVMEVWGETQPAGSFLNVMDAGRVIHAYAGNNQIDPAIAIARKSPSSPFNTHYASWSQGTEKPFAQRRMVLWAADAQAFREATESGVVGFFNGIRVRTSPGDSTICASWRSQDLIQGSALVEDGRDTEMSPEVAFESDIRPAPFTLESPSCCGPSSTVRFTLPRAMPVRLDLFDVNGRLVRTLADAEFGQGEHAIEVDRNTLRTGMYYVRMKAGAFVEARKMLLLQ